MSKRYVPEPRDMWFDELIRAAMNAARKVGTPTETIARILRLAIGNLHL